jgi:hypothetical protein
MIIGRDTPWEAMLGEDESEATEEEVAAVEAAHGPFLPADGKGVDRAFIQRPHRACTTAVPVPDYNV